MMVRSMLFNPSVKASPSWKAIIKAGTSGAIIGGAVAETVQSYYSDEAIKFVTTYPVASTSTILAFGGVGLCGIYTGLLFPLAGIAVAAIGPVLVMDSYKYSAVADFLRTYEIHYSAVVTGIAASLTFGGLALPISVSAMTIMLSELYYNRDKALEYLKDRLPISAVWIGAGTATGGLIGGWYGALAGTAYSIASCVVGHRISIGGTLISSVLEVVIYAPLLMAGAFGAMAAGGLMGGVVPMLLGAALGASYVYNIEYISSHQIPLIVGITGAAGLIVVPRSILGPLFAISVSALSLVIYPRFHNRFYHDYYHYHQYGVTYMRNSYGICAIEIIGGAMAGFSVRDRVEVFSIDGFYGAVVGVTVGATSCAVDLEFTPLIYVVSIGTVVLVALSAIANPEPFLLGVRVSIPFVYSIHLYVHEYGKNIEVKTHTKAIGGGIIIGNSLGELYGELAGTTVGGFYGAVAGATVGATSCAVEFDFPSFITKYVRDDDKYCSIDIAAGMTIGGSIGGFYGAVAGAAFGAIKCTDQLGSLFTQAIFVGIATVLIDKAASIYLESVIHEESGFLAIATALTDKVAGSYLESVIHEQFGL